MSADTATELSAQLFSSPVYDMLSTKKVPQISYNIMQNVLGYTCCQCLPKASAGTREFQDVEKEVLVTSLQPGALCLQSVGSTALKDSVMLFEPPVNRYTHLLCPTIVVQSNCSTGPKNERLCDFNVISDFLCE